MWIDIPNLIFQFQGKFSWVWPFTKNWVSKHSDVHPRMRKCAFFWHHFLRNHWRWVKNLYNTPTKKKVPTGNESTSPKKSLKNWMFPTKTCLKSHPWFLSPATVGRPRLEITLSRLCQCLRQLGGTRQFEASQRLWKCFQYAISFFGEHLYNEICDVRLNEIKNSSW